MKSDLLVIIDGNSLINRAYYAIQRPMITADGMYTQGIYGFLNMLSRIRSDYKPTHMLVAFDRKAPTFRHLEYKDYKAGRKKMPEELAMELPVLKEILALMGIKCCELDGYEADDIIGTAAAMADAEGLPAMIITGDRDALQLATDNTSVLITKKGISEFKLYDDAAMMEEYGFDHKQFIDFKALFGDASDNIPGVPGVGEKTAAKLVREFGSVENLLNNIESLKEGKLKTALFENSASALMSKHLATIITSVPVDFKLKDLAVGTADTGRLIDIYKKLEFKTFLNRLLSEQKKVNKSAASKDFGGESAKAYAASGANTEGGDTKIGLFPVIEEPSACTYIQSEKEAEELLLSLDGSVFIDIDCDDSHIDIPKVRALEIAYNGHYCIYGVSGLGELAARCLSGKNLRLSGFNLGRLYYALIMHGCDVSGITTEFDCAVAQYVISPSAKAPGLEELLFSEFQVKLSDEPDTMQMDMFAAQTESYASCAKKLALLSKLCEIQRQKLERDGLGFIAYEIEFPLVKVLSSMEAAGIRLDTKELKHFGEGLKDKIRQLEDEIISLAGESFNINSPSQLGRILFEKLGLPAGKKTKSGYSTGAEILEKLATDYPIAEKVLEYRTLTKLLSTYVDGLIPLCGKDGKVHCHFQQTVTATGRISCTEPNLQNIPVRKEPGKFLRKAFTAGSEDYVLIGADYSQIELRVLAHMSKDPVLIDCFNRGLDIHRETASKVFGVPQEEVTPLMRSAAKAVNFGVIYGMSGFGLATELTISRKQAEQYINDYFERFKDVKIFMDECVKSCREKGCSYTLFGRRRAVPEIGASSYMVRQLGERLAMNTPIQGTAADIIKLAMIKVYDSLKAACPSSALVLQIHDELIIHAKKDEEEKVLEILKSSMESAADLSVRLEVSVNRGQNWLELK